MIKTLNICEIRQLNKEFTLLESFKHIGDEVYAVDIYYPNEYLKMKNSDKMSSDILLYSSNLIKIKKPEPKKHYQKTFIDNNLNTKEDNSNVEEVHHLERSKTVIITKKRKQQSEKNSVNIKKNSEYKEKKNESISNSNSEFIKSLKNKKIDIDSSHNEKDKESKNDISFSIITLDIDGNVNLYQYGEEVTLFNSYNFKDISQKIKNDKFFSMGYEYYIKSNLEYFCISTDHGCFVVKKNF